MPWLHTGHSQQAALGVGKNRISGPVLFISGRLRGCGVLPYGRRYPTEVGAAALWPIDLGHVNGTVVHVVAVLEDKHPLHFYSLDRESDAGTGVSLAASDV